MNYKFDVYYIPHYLEKVNEHMKELDPEWEKAAIMTTLQVSHEQELTHDQVKQDISHAFSRDGHKVIKIEGGIVG